MALGLLEVNIEISDEILSFRDSFYFSDFQIKIFRLGAQIE